MTARKPKHFAPGDVVRFTPAFLGSTGQTNSSEARRRFTVRECSCSLCKMATHVATDESRPVSYLLLSGYTEDEIADNPSLVWRHIAVSNLQRAR